jgi:hypothetical protein
LVAALGQAACGDITIPELPEMCGFGTCGYTTGGGLPKVVLTPDSLRLIVGEVAEVEATGVIGVYWSVRDSATIRVPEGLSGPGAPLTPMTEVTAIQSGDAWVIGYINIYQADSAWVVVE